MAKILVKAVIAPEYTDPLAACLCAAAGACRRVGHSPSLPHVLKESAMTLSEARFHDLVDALQQEIEDLFDDSGLDVDLENSNGVLTVRFDNGSQLILSRQEPLRQLWVAARSGGFHFDYDQISERWICDTSGERLGELLSRVVSEQAGEALGFDAL